MMGRVPSVVSSILQSPHLKKNQDVDLVFYAGAPPSKELAREVSTRWPNAGMSVDSRPFSSLGMTFVQISSVRSDGDHRLHLRDRRHRLHRKGGSDPLRPRVVQYH